MDKENVQAIYPLTETQEGFYFYGLRETRDPGAIQVRFSLLGSISREDIQTAWTRVVERHEALRMSVQSPGNRKPMLVVGKRVEAPVLWLDRSVEQKDHASGISLSDLPSHRLTVRSESAELHEFVWDCHHLLLDGWSAMVVLRDFLALYSRERGQSADLPVVSSHADYLRWKRERSSDETNAYWRDYLTGRNSSRARPIRSDRSSGEGKVTLRPEFTSEVRQCAARYHVTSAAIAQSAWAIMLAAMSDLGGGGDVIFGCSTAGRNFDLPCRDYMVGLFANVIPRRAAVNPDLRLSELLKRMHLQNFESADHEYCGLPQIERQYAGDGAMFETLLVFENLPSAELCADVDGGVRLTNYSAGLTSGFPLTIVITPGDHWTISWFGDGTVFDASEGQRATEGFAEVLTKLACSEDVPLRELLDSFADRSSSILDLADDVADQTEQAEPAASATEMKIAAIWEELLGVTGVDVTTDFQQLGGRSLMAARMVAMIENRTGYQVRLQDLVAKPTVRGLAALVDSGVPCESPWRTLVPIKPRGNKPPLVCVHVGGMHALFLRDLAKHMDRDQPVLAFQPIGLDGECTPLSSFKELASLYLSELRTVQPEGPYYLTGHCFGAKVAFEMAQQLIEDGQSIAVLVAIDTIPPLLKAQSYEMPADRRTNSRKRQIADLVSRGKLLQLAYRVVRSVILNTAAQVRGLPASLRLKYRTRFGSFEQKQDITLNKVQDACIAAFWRYRAEKLPIDITLVRSRDTKVEHDEWQFLTDNLREINLPIGHESMFSDPEVAVLAECLTTLINEAVVT